MNESRVETHKGKFALTTQKVTLGAPNFFYPFPPRRGVFSATLKAPEVTMAIEFVFGALAALREIWPQARAIASRR